MLPLSDTGPLLMFDPHEHIWCPRHGEPFRAEYPKGFPLATIKLFQAVMARTDLQEQVKFVTNSDKLPPEAVLPFLKQRPACCRVGKQELLTIYKESGIGTSRRCNICKKYKLGAPYQMKNPFTKRTRKYKHVCFDCVVNSIIANSDATNPQT